MRKFRRIWFVYFGSFLLSIHYATIVYLNSSLLKQFVSDNALNILYIIGSALSLIFLYFGPLLLRKYGSIITFCIFIVLEIIAVFGMGSAIAAILLALLFLLHQAAESILSLCIDVNLEQEIKREGVTGEKRGILLTVSNLAWVISPLFITLFALSDKLSKVYFLSGIALLPLAAIVLFFFKNTDRASANEANIRDSLKLIMKDGDKGKIIGAQFILQFFYSWMIIYLPLTLSLEMGFGWDKIGLLFTIMLLPFLLFELPAGILEDKKTGEKEILFAGFIIMALATFFIPFIRNQIFWLWATVLFLTRTGASLVEISSESYFFKQVNEDDTALISLFRMSRPLSFILAPIIAIPIIHFFSYSISFFFLSAITILGLLFIPKIDTR